MVEPKCIYRWVCFGKLTSFSKPFWCPIKANAIDAPTTHSLTVAMTWTLTIWRHFSRSSCWTAITKKLNAYWRNQMFQSITDSRVRLCLILSFYIGSPRDFVITASSYYWTNLPTFYFCFLAACFPCTHLGAKWTYHFFWRTTKSMGQWFAFTQPIWLFILMQRLSRYG